MPLLLFVRHIVFIAFFLFAGVRRVAFLPLLGGVFLFLYSSTTDSEIVHDSTALKSWISEYSLTLSRVMMMIGVRGFLDIMHEGSIWSGGILMLINGFMRIGSYVAAYNEGKRIFHVGRYLATILFFTSIWMQLGGEVLLDLTMLRVSMTLSLYAFLVFVLGSIDLVDDHRLNYPLFIFLNICILFLIYHYTQSTGGFALMVSQAYLFCVYGLIWRIYATISKNPQGYSGGQDELFRHILSGQQITTFSVGSMRAPLELVQDVYTFLDSMSSKTKRVMGFLNIVLVVLQTGLFIWNIREGLEGMDNLWFWGGTLFFFGSFLLLRTIGYAYKLQRIVAFMLLNFGMYLSIIAWFGNDIMYIVTIGIVWTIINSFAVFQLNIIDPRHFLNSQDVRYWIFGTVLATLCNLYFMMRMPLSLQLIFSLIFFYLGIQGFLMRYNLMSVQKMEREER